MGRLIKFEDFKAEDDMPKGTKEVMGGTPDNPSGCWPQAVLPEMAGPVDDDEEVEAGEEELEETKITSKAQGYVSTKIAKLKSEGYPADQAAAIAFSMAKKRGFDVDEAETEEYAAPKDAVKSFDKEDEETIKKVNEKKPHPTINKVNEKKPNPHMKKHLKARNELDENVEDEYKPLDAPYITDMIASYAAELKSDAESDEEHDVAAELRQVARSMKAQYPNNRDIGVDEVLEIADEQGIEDDKILAKVKEEISYMWNQA